VSEFAIHPAAALFPMLADDELDELAADIKERGLLQPIVLDAQGRVLDGRNRLAACEKAGIEPDYVTYADGDPDGYALAVNINRRHLKASARHLITEMARRLAGGGQFAKMQTAEVVAKAGDVDGARLSEVGVVLDYAPDLVEKIFTGGITRQQAAAALAVNRALKRKGQSHLFKACDSGLFFGTKFLPIIFGATLQIRSFFYCPVGTSPDSKSCNGFNN
jgi:ParB-like chromosome segregation protein Spo0J